MAFLSVKNLTKSFGATKVLDGIDLDVEKGEVISVIGSSGNGKTTLLRCLNFLETPEKGSIKLNEELVFEAGKRYNESELLKNRLHFGLVFQSFNLFPQYSAVKNVRLAMDVAAKRTYKGRANKPQLKAALEQNAAEAERLLKDVGLGDKLNSYPCELSGGQCQRVAIARALALRPEVLCFDEPTSALDPELTGEVLRVIAALRSPDRAMLIVTHEMKFAADVSDRVIFMSDGRIEEEGPPDKIFGSPESEKTKAFLKNALNGGSL